MKKKYFAMGTSIIGCAVVVSSGAVWAQNPPDMRDHSTSTSPQWSSDDVHAVQRALQRQGYYAGSIDGVFRPSMQEALRNYQNSWRLPATGQIDNSTMSALGMYTSQSGHSGLR